MSQNPNKNTHARILGRVPVVPTRLGEKLQELLHLPLTASPLLSFLSSEKLSPPLYSAGPCEGRMSTLEADTSIVFAHFTLLSPIVIAQNYWGAVEHEIFKLHLEE